MQPADTKTFVDLGIRMGQLLTTINRVEGVVGKGKGPKLVTRKGEASRLEDQGGGVVEWVDAAAGNVGMRDTLTVSPAISRALQRMIADGHTAQARVACEDAMWEIGIAYEETFRGAGTWAKVCSMVPHVGSGHFHFDLWVHSTYLTTVEVGTAGKLVPARLWDARATSHYGPGPGVTFWTRHLDTLGDLDELAKTEPEAAARAGYTKMVCEQAIFGCEKRSAQSHAKAVAKKAEVEASGGVYKKWIRPADDCCRDIRITLAVDQAMSRAIRAQGLAIDYFEIGRLEYRMHLIEAYAAGNTGLRMDTAQDLETAAGVAKRAEARVREEREAADAALIAATAEKAEAIRIRDEMTALIAGVDAGLLSIADDRAATTEALRVAKEDRRAAASLLATLEAREANLSELTHKAGLWDRAEGMLARVAALWTPAEKTQMVTIAAADQGTTPLAGITTINRVLARVFGLAGLLPGKDKTPDIDEK